MKRKFIFVIFSFFLSLSVLFSSTNFTHAATMQYYLRDDFSMQMFYLGSVNYTDTYLTLGSKYSTTLNHNVKNLNTPTFPIQNGSPYLRSQHKHVLYPTEINTILEAGIPTTVVLSGISNHYCFEFVKDEQHLAQIAFRTYVPFDLNYMNYRFKYSDGTYSSSFSLPRSAYRYDSHQGTYTIEYEFLSQSKDVSCIEIYIDFIFDGLADQYYNFKSGYPDGFMDITPYYGGGSQYPEFSSVVPKLFYEPKDAVEAVLDSFYENSMTWFERLKKSIDDGISNIMKKNSDKFDELIDWFNDFIYSYDINSNALNNFFSSLTPFYEDLFNLDSNHKIFIDDSNEFYNDYSHVVDDTKDVFNQIEDYETDLSSIYSNIPKPPDDDAFINSLKVITNNKHVTRIVLSVFSVATLGYVFFGKK